MFSVLCVIISLTSIVCLIVLIGPISIIYIKNIHMFKREMF
jgi:hypothetical protein